MDKNIIQGIGPAVEQTLGNSDYEVAVNTFTVKVSAYNDGGVYFIIPDVTNSGATTLSIEGLATIVITRNGGGALQAGDFVGGRTYMLQYFSSAGTFVIVSTITTDLYRSGSRAITIVQTQITFSTPLPSNNYQVQITDNNGVGWGNIADLQTTGFKITGLSSGTIAWFVILNN